MFEAIPNLSAGQIAHGTARKEFSIAHPDQSAHQTYSFHFFCSVGFVSDKGIQSTQSKKEEDTNIKNACTLTVVCVYVVSHIRCLFQASNKYQ